MLPTVCLHACCRHLKLTLPQRKYYIQHCVKNGCNTKQARCFTGTTSHLDVPEESRNYWLTWWITAESIMDPKACLPRFQIRHAERAVGQEKQVIQGFWTSGQWRRRWSEARHSKPFSVFFSFSLLWNKKHRQRLVVFIEWCIKSFKQILKKKIFNHFK